MYILSRNVKKISEFFFNQKIFSFGGVFVMVCAVAYVVFVLSLFVHHPFFWSLERSVFHGNGISWVSLLTLFHSYAKRCLFNFSYFLFGVRKIDTNSRRQLSKSFLPPF